MYFSIDKNVIRVCGQDQWIAFSIEIHIHSRACVSHDWILIFPENSIKFVSVSYRTFCVWSYYYGIVCLLQITHTVTCITETKLWGLIAVPRVQLDGLNVRGRPIYIQWVTEVVRFSFGFKAFRKHSSSNCVRVCNSCNAAI